MTFTFTNYAAIKPQHSPLNDAVGKMLRGYMGGVSAKYAPQQQEADIFSKKIGPLATLATSPMFLQNPQFQAALGNLIAKNLNFGGSEFSGGSQNAMPTYADQVNKDVKEGEEIANHLASAGKIKTGISGGAGWVENNLGDVGKHITKFFSGGKVDSHLAQEENRLKDILQSLKNNMIQTQRMTERQVNETFNKRENETYKQMFTRLKKTNPNLFQQNKPAPKNDNNKTEANEKTIEENNDEYRFALDLADQISSRTGKTISEMKILDYMSKHPGKINVPALLKEVGE